MTDAQQPLPIDEVLPELKAKLSLHGSAVMIATPGAGKTTRVPLALLGQTWLGDRSIIMLEPRRLAARMAAERMARSTGRAVGDLVGYRVRLDSKVSAATRIEVLTEGLFTRRLQDDPSLDGIGLVILDEFHERSLDADFGFALTLDARRGLRPDLKVMVMSATIDAAPIARLLDDAPIIESTHRPYPVATRHIPRDAGVRLEDAVASAVARALSDDDGSVLVFLPGEREIRRAVDALSARRLPGDVDLVPLYGALPWSEQRRAVEPPAPGRRKVVLATTIAETSLTIEGVSVVVDSGLKRVPRFDPGRGMSELATVRVSRAAAEQRRGRAGRLGPGVCYRLWAEAENRALTAYDEPEIGNADLAPLALDIAAWGVANPDDLPWLTPPPAAAFAQARAVLVGLGALDAEGRITAEGKAMVRLPLHPRLAHMVRVGAALDAGGVAADLAAVLSDRDSMPGRRDIDIRSRLQGLRTGQAPQRLKDAARQVRDLARAPRGAAGDEVVGRLIAAAYPDRVGQSRGGIGKFRLAGGGSAVVEDGDALARAEFLAIADLDGAAANARAYLAAPISRADLEAQFHDSLTDAEEVTWDDRTEAVAARRVRRLGALVLAEQTLSDPADARVIDAVLTGIRRLGLTALPWDDGLLALRARVAFVRSLDPATAWPDLADEALTETLEHWLAPYVQGVARRTAFSRIDLRAAIQSLLPWPLPQRLDDMAPVRLTVPSGSSVEVDYSATGGPSLSVKLQEVFGLTATPKVGGGRVAVTMHLLSPARRPLAVTADLGSFWRNAYPAVRAEMRGRYPRHTWPEDPLAAPPTRRSIKPRG